MKASVFIIIIALAISWEAVAQPAQLPNAGTTYTNSVIAGDFVDPSVVRVGDTYFAVGTFSE